MSYRHPLFATLAALIGAIAAMNSAHAQQVERTWVASNGDDSSLSCTRPAPCRRFDSAYGKTKVSGEITCVDSAGYGSLVIAKSITINCLNTDGSGGTNSSSNGVNYVVNTNAGDRVLLRGFDVGSAQSQFADSGIVFTGAGTLVLDRVKISDAGSGFNGVVMATSGPGKLIVLDSILNFNGGVSGGAGIRVVPSGGGTAQVMLERVTAIGNQFGLAVDGSQSTGGINATISDSTFSSNVNDGIVATSDASHAPIGVTVINSRSANNGFGIRSIGSNVTVRVEGSKIIGNGMGLSGGGALLSGGNNTVQANASNGGFTGSYPQQ